MATVGTEMSMSLDGFIADPSGEVGPLFAWYGTGAVTVPIVGDDWAEDHHDVCLQDTAGRVLAARRLPEGVAGITRLHELVAGHLDGDDPSQVVVAIETDRGPWVRALVAAGYRVYAVNPKQAARHREVVAVSGKKDDAFDGGAGGHGPYPPSPAA